MTANSAFVFGIDLKWFDFISAAILAMNPKYMRNNMIVVSKILSFYPTTRYDCD